MSIFIHHELHVLRQAFLAHDRDLRLVGGVVRCYLLGEPVADIDLATNATPDEQAAIYLAHNVAHFPTGVQHGTWTILLSDRTPVEITSLRHETGHDGRHAIMTWSQNWQDDLARRDLTINAMAMAFDGTLFDPFNGADDLARRCVRFVGDPKARITEDYLRILRFFRFHARIAGTAPYDATTLAAIESTKGGLAFISRERVWAEMAKIISGPWGVKTFYDIIRMGIAPHIDLINTPFQKPHLNEAAEFQETRDPVSLMARYIGSRIGVAAQANMWRWSNQEKQQGCFIASLLSGTPELSLAQASLLATRGVAKYWLAETLRLLDKPLVADELLSTTLPEFPLMGSDLLMLLGMVEGPDIGQLLKNLRTHWESSDYSLDKDALLDIARVLRSV